jgi:hypothetical protein
MAYAPKTPVIAIIRARASFIPESLAAKRNITRRIEIIVFAKKRILYIISFDIPSGLIQSISKPVVKINIVG